MNGIKIDGGNGFMSFINLEFEHAVRILKNRVREFKRKPEERERQLALFRALQSTKLLYNEVSRMGEMRYECNIDKISKVTQDTSSLLSGRTKFSPVLQGIRYQLAAIRNKTLQNHKKANTPSNYAKTSSN